MEALEWIKFIIGTIFLFVGIFFFIMEIIGVFHFKYILNRMHAASIGDTLGIGISLLGLIIMNGFNNTSLKIFLVILFLWFASPVSSHVISRLEVTTNKNLEQHCEVEDN